MLLLFNAGLVAASRQVAAVALLTDAFLISTSLGLLEADLAICGAETCTSAAPLALAYVALAAGFALTASRSVLLTAERIRRASRIKNPVAPERVAKPLAVQLGLSAVLLAAFALQTPPDPLASAAQHFGCACAAFIGWAGLLSIGVAGFGAGAHASVKAF